MRSAPSYILDLRHYDITHAVPPFPVKTKDTSYEVSIILTATIPFFVHSLIIIFGIVDLAM